MNHFVKSSIAILVVPIFSGCALFEYGDSRPLISSRADHGSAEFMAIKAERRMIFSQPNVRPEERVKFCSEPPPDIAESFSDSIKTALNASVEKGSDKMTGSLEMARDYATAVSAIYTRSQGVQLFRDASFTLCQAYLNGALQGDMDHSVNSGESDESRSKRLAYVDSILKRYVEKGNSVEVVDKFMKLGDSDKSKLIDVFLQGGGQNYSSLFQQLLMSTSAILQSELKYIYLNKLGSANENTVTAPSTTAPAGGEVLKK